MSVTNTTTPLLEWALLYARRGWPVFPCNPANKRPLLARDLDGDGRPIKGSGGVSKASTDEAEIRAWWAKWPRAMIGLAVGRAGLLVVDFDPRREEIVDDSTGEVTIVEWTLEQLKADLEAQMGCALPPSLSVRTPSGGVHVYFLMPAGDPIGNRGNLPRHVDVRGLGGYVIVPPSSGDAGAYRWLRDEAGAPVAAMPEQLVTILRSAPARVERTPAEPRRVIANDVFLPDLDEAHRRYALKALDEELIELEQTPIGGGRYGGRNAGIYHAALKLGGFVLAGALRESVVRAGIEAVVRGMPNNDDLAGALNAIDNGFANAQPRDLSAVGARMTRGRDSGRTASSSLAVDDRPLPPVDAYRGDEPPDRAARATAPPRAAKSGQDEPSQTGRIDRISALAEAERARVLAASAKWLARRMERIERAKDPILRLAFSAGRRVAAGLHDVNAVRQTLWDTYDSIADLTHADVDKALADGEARGFDLAPWMLTLKCAGYPLTDFGIAERFRDRFGADYRFTTGKGWLGWDGRRWKVLDQDEKTPPAEVIAAVFDTVRLIQEEATFIADTGVRWELVKDGKEQRLDLDDEGNPHGLDKWIAKGKSFVLFSDMVRAFGRTSETTSKPASVATLARRWLTVPIEQFDLDPLAIGVLNGTLRFAKQVDAAGKRSSSVELCPHRREDYNTKLAPIEYDPAAASPLYDDMIAWAQPDAVMRRYLHQVGGYCSTGLTGEHKLWYWYGRGRNGKSTTIDAWCHVLGDYSGTTLIETFLDQGIKKRGDQASPDIARLGGVRLLRSSEPERGAKLNAALIKFVTGGEPVPTRALHRGFFDLLPQFKPIISGNSKPDIPDTDDGIWSRLKLVSWLKNIDLEFNPDGTPKKDPELLNKIKAREAAGVFNRLVEGLLDYLANGLIEPAAVTADTQAYRDASDPLARFLRDCVIADEHSTVQSSVLHGVFVAWCKAAGEREWTNKGFSKAMEDKGYRKGKSNNILWENIRLLRFASDFVDEHGNVREGDDLSPVAGQPPPRLSPATGDDDDIPL